MKLFTRSQRFVRSGFLVLTSTVLILGAFFNFVQFLPPVSAGTQTNSEIFYKRSTDGGATFGDYYNISNDAEDSSIAHVAAENGVVHILWDRNPQPREAFYRRSPDGGISFEPTFNVSSNNGDSSESDLTTAGNTLHAVWEEDYLTPDGNPDPCCSGDEAYYRRSGNGGVSFGTGLNISNTPSAHSRDPDVAASGSLVGIVYEDPTPGSDNIFFNRSVDDGATWSSYVNVSNGTGAEPSVAISGNNVHAVWQSGRYNRSLDGGVSFVGATNLPSGFGTGPQVAAVGSTVHVVGCSSSGGSFNYVRSLDNGQTWGSTINLGGGCKKPTIAATSNGVYAVWENKSGTPEVYFRKSANNGTSFDPAINMSNNEGSSGEPSVAVDPTTGFIYVVWYDNTTPTPPTAPSVGGPTSTPTPTIDPALTPTPTTAPSPTPTSTPTPAQTACIAPTILTHSDTNSTGGGTVTFSWGAVAGASQYRVQRQKNDGTWSTRQTSSSTTFSGADASSDPNWRVFVNAGTCTPLPGPATVFDP